MKRVKISTNVHQMIFDNKAEAIKFRNDKWLEKRAELIAARKQAHINRANGLRVTRPTRLPRIPATIDISNNRATWCHAHRDYWTIVGTGSALGRLPA
jgi:hypothetical protein